MSRSVIQDLLQVYPFWLFDAFPVEPLAFPVLTPLFGFSAITAPEITAEVLEITEGNWYFKKKIIKGADVGAMTLERGCTFYDSDFWRWMLASISGDLSNSKLGFGPVSLKVGGITPRRTLMLVQFMTRMPFKLPEGTDAVVAIATKTALSATAVGLAGGSLLDVGAAAAQSAIFATLAALGPFEFAARLPAKAWLLHGAIPSRYKTTGDFDASSHAVSIQQLELAVEMVEEISLTA